MDLKRAFPENTSKGITGKPHKSLLSELDGVKKLADDVLTSSKVSSKWKLNDQQKSAAVKAVLLIFRDISYI